MSEESFILTHSNLKTIKDMGIKAGEKYLKGIYNEALKQYGEPTATKRKDTKRKPDKGV